jgi:hypothetical protein
VECVESMLFDVKGQAKEGGMQVYGNVISCYKDRMFFHLGYQCDGNGQIGVAVCSKAHPRVKALLAQCVGLVPPPLHGSTNPYPRWANKRCGHGNIEFASTFQMKRARTFTPPYKQHRRS